jgi:Na+:H+ antiporter, NhaA family
MVRQETIKRNKLRHHILTPLRDLLNDSRATGILLICCTVVSVFLANFFPDRWYLKFWSHSLPGVSAIHLPASFLDWINNFFMAFFFILAATEIKRELLSGELSTFKKAILPFGAAFGGMLVPALIFTAFNFHSNYSHGWGIPTATDIAFSIGAASLLGKRFPVGLKILLMALAIIDDLGAIIVIAVFYGGHIQWLYLGGCGLVYGLLLTLNFLKVRFGVLQIFLGIIMWYLMLQSGVEASITGVLFAFAMPVGSLGIIEKAIHKYVNFLILPLFALANTAILISSNIISSLSTTISLGIICGLVIGKPLGIFLVSRIMVALNIAQLPGNIKWKQVFGMGTLAGIGFTMSIFTTMLAFTSSEARDIAKIAILTSVIASVVLSFIYFRIIGAVNLPAGVPSIAIPEKEPEIQLNIS